MISCALMELRLNRHRIHVIPSKIGSLTKLKILEIPHNCLSSLPASLKHLSALEDVSVECNSFSEFPKEILSIPNLVSLSIDQHIIPPKDIGKVLPRLERILVRVSLSESKYPTDFEVFAAGMQFQVLHRRQIEIP